MQQEAVGIPNQQAAQQNAPLASTSTTSRPSPIPADMAQVRTAIAQTKPQASTSTHQIGTLPEDQPATPQQMMDINEGKFTRPAQTLRPTSISTPTRDEVSYISPSDILRFPKAPARKKFNRGRKKAAQGS